MKTPETSSAYGGKPDANLPHAVRRMEGRARLLAELQWVRSEIDLLEGATPLIRENRGI